MKIIAFFYFIAVHYQLVKGAIAPPLVCGVTVHANRSATYHLSEPTPSTTCDTQWMYPNGTVLTFKDDKNVDTILVLTNQSITTNLCLGNLNYSEDCVEPEGIRDVQCVCNCSIPASNLVHVSSGPYPRNHYAAVGLFIAVLPLLVLVLCLRGYLISDVKDCTKPNSLTRN